MKFVTNILVKLGILKEDLDYHFVRASMVIIFLFFGYQKWFDYEAQALIPYISNGPLISWLYPVFGIRGACWFLGVAEWFFGALLFAGFWNKKLGVFGALGAIFSFISTITITSDDRNRCFSDEGPGSSVRICLFAAAGRSESVTVRQRIFSCNRRTAAAHLIVAQLTGEIRGKETHEQRFGSQRGDWSRLCQAWAPSFGTAQGARHWRGTSGCCRDREVSVRGLGCGRRLTTQAQAAQRSRN